MAYAGRTKAVIYSMTNADAIVTGLGASATVFRYIRQLHACNATAGALTWNFGVGASLVQATAQVFGKTIAANSVDQIFFSPGLRVTNLDMRAFASATTSVTLSLTYDEEVV